MFTTYDERRKGFYHFAIVVGGEDVSVYYGIATDLSLDEFEEQINGFSWWWERWYVSPRTYPASVLPVWEAPEELTSFESIVDALSPWASHRVNVVTYLVKKGWMEHGEKLRFVSDRTSMYDQKNDVVYGDRRPAR